MTQISARLAACECARSGYVKTFRQGMSPKQEHQTKMRDIGIPGMAALECTVQSEPGARSDVFVRTVSRWSCNSLSVFMDEAASLREQI